MQATSVRADEAPGSTVRRARFSALIANGRPAAKPQKGARQQPEQTEATGGPVLPDFGERGAAHPHFFASG